MGESVTRALNRSAFFNYGAVISLPPSGHLFQDTTGRSAIPCTFSRSPSGYQLFRFIGTAATTAKTSNEYITIITFWQRLPGSASNCVRSVTRITKLI